MTGAKVGFAAIVIAYPLVVYFGLQYFDARLLAVIIVVMAMARLFLDRKADGVMAAMPHARLVIIALLVFGVLTLATNVPVLLQYYPVVMNALMFTLFFVSLMHPPSMIERIARISTPDLPEAGVAYTRKVTMVWCGFFILNGSMALYTTTSTSLGFWAVYNSLISYTLMGLLFGGEYCIRRVVQKRSMVQNRANGWC